MKEENDKGNLEEEDSELDIEELTDIQGGIEDGEKSIIPSCGLGCFQGSGSPDHDKDE